MNLWQITAVTTRFSGLIPNRSLRMNELLLIRIQEIWYELLTADYSGLFSTHCRLQKSLRLCEKDGTIKHPTETRVP